MCFSDVHPQDTASSHRALGASPHPRWPLPGSLVAWLSPALAPKPHLPGVVLVLGAHREDHHLEGGQPQRPGWERAEEGELRIQAPTARAAAA